MRLKRGTSTWKYDFRNIFFQGYSENNPTEIKQYYVNNVLVGYELDYGDKTFYI